MSTPSTPSYSASTAASATRNKPTMSWLSPKRRRTTSNLKTVRQGQGDVNSISEERQDEASVAVNHHQAVGRPVLSPRAATHFAGISSNRRRESLEVAKSGKKDVVGGRKERGDSVIDVGGVGLEVEGRRGVGAVESPLDVGPANHGDISTQLAHMNDVLTAHTERMEIMARAQAESEQRIRTMLEGASPRRSSAEFLDLSHLWTYLDRIQGTVEQLVEEHRELKKSREDSPETTAVVSVLELSRVIERLDSLQSAVEDNSGVVRAWLEERTSEHEAVVPASMEVHQAIENNAREPGLEAIEAVRAAIQDMVPALSSVRDSTVENTKELKSVLGMQKELGNRYRSVDLGPLTNRLASIHNTLLERPVPKDLKSDLRSVAASLEDIHTLADQNATAIQSLAAQNNTTQNSLRQISSQTRSLAETSRKVNVDRDSRLDTMKDQLRVAVAGQTEMCELMRSWMEDMHPSKSASCGHVISPPPRKVGRKIVGFVYDR
ncbi:hypothetical protein TI39_contig1039g00001 [Zymoseptoria brevis]|uniref:Uncharacterized protein n=1 Tax=Zymoseptoria brevis TaxID=1047168 RepID=A0A0F4GFN3_9PEZI|nr:hypothetical protein TI39_contig1039g00001 [Zymoseptoria brevis]